MSTNTNVNRSISVLLVEDDEEILELQASIIVVKYPELMLYTATDGKSGLDLFKAHMPEIVITDINMKEMCGVQMAAAIRALKPDTKFIAITGKTELLERHNPADKPYSFDHIIVKPVDLVDLFAVINKHLSEIEPALNLQTQPSSANTAFAAATDEAGF